MDAVHGSWRLWEAGAPRGLGLRSGLRCDPAAELREGGEGTIGLWPRPGTCTPLSGGHHRSHFPPPEVHSRGAGARCLTSSCRLGLCSPWGPRTGSRLPLPASGAPGRFLGLWVCPSHVCLCLPVASPCLRLPVCLLQGHPT